MSGIRAELVFDTPETCPVAGISDGVDDPVTDISWTESVDGTVKEQFTAASVEGNGTADEVFDYGTQQVYEFERDETDPCICEYVQQSIGPVTDIYASDGDLHLTLHAGEMDGLRDLLSNLSNRFGNVRVAYLLQDRGEVDDADLVPVDLNRLTARQREVLQTAHKMGYFDYPRDANASDVAAALDIESSTFIEHLNAAQSKLLEELL
jgi:predicted DNA binding protein